MGAAASGDEDDVGLERRLLAVLGALVAQRDLLATGVGAEHLLARLDLDALLLEHALERLADVRVERRHDGGRVLEDRHLGTKARPDGAHLEADDAAAHHDELLRHLFQLQRTRGRHNPAPAVTPIMLSSL